MTGSPGILDARDKSRLVASNRLQFIEYRRVFEGWDGQECSGYLLSSASFLPGPICQTNCFVAYVKRSARCEQVF